MTPPRPLRAVVLQATAADPRSLARRRGLERAGADVRALAFERAEGVPPGLDPGVELLGRVPHGRLATRAGPYLRALSRLEDAVRTADLAVASGTDLALLALTARRGSDGHCRVVLDVPDVREALVGSALRARLLRTVERAVLRRVDLVIAASPEMAASYLREQGVPERRCLVIENKLDEAAPAPLPPRRPGLPLHVGLFGMLRCRRSWDVLRRAMDENPARMRVVVRGTCRWGDLERSLRAHPGVAWGGPYRSPEDLAAMHASVDLSWIAHDHATANARWARATRYYAACFHRTPVIAQRGTPDASRVAEEGTGVVVDLRDPDAAIRTLLDLSPGDVLRWRRAQATLPEERYLMAGEHLELLRRLGLAPSP